MTLQERIYSFIELGKDLKQFTEEDIHNLALRAKSGNSWFTHQNIQLTLDTLINYLHPDSLLPWLERYNLSREGRPKRVGVVMAGDIPAEGFHDFMCVLLSGHVLLAKLHIQDEVILKQIARLLIDISPDWQERIIFADRLNEADAIIATVKEKSVHQFNRYLGHLPTIIRTHRRSCAVLNGNETDADLTALGNDILQHFGLGSRNVSKIYVPETYSFDQFFNCIEPWKDIIHHHKYLNNYEYNKSILLVSQKPYQDNGFLLLSENEGLASPVAVLHFEHYTYRQELAKKIQAHSSQLQNIVSQKGWFPQNIPFGHTAKPALAHYEGGIDTMQFLSSL
jgi:hypothetical protein